MHSVLVFRSSLFEINLVNEVDDSVYCEVDLLRIISIMKNLRTCVEVGLHTFLLASFFHIVFNILLVKHWQILLI